MNGADAVDEGDLAVLDRHGEAVSIEAAADSTILVLSGAPIDEPVVGYGPFVMNSEAEIRKAMEDYRSGRMGLPPVAGNGRFEGGGDGGGGGGCFSPAFWVSFTPSCGAKLPPGAGYRRRPSVCRRRRRPSRATTSCSSPPTISER